MSKRCHALVIPFKSLDSGIINGYISIMEYSTSASIIYHRKLFQANGDENELKKWSRRIRNSEG
jgi:hypothetical protein